MFYNPEMAIVLRPMTPDEEVAYLWPRFKNVDFYIRGGYDLSIPESWVMDALMVKALTGTLADRDQEVFAKELKKVYRESDYRQGFNNLAMAMASVNIDMGVFKTYEALWGFKVFDAYQVCLTRFGPGGSYDHEKGKVIVKVNAKGLASKTCDFKSLLVHEMVHIGLEEVIIKKFDLTHTVKERLVDHFLWAHFSSALPAYSFQKRGDPGLDPYLDHEDVWQRLPEYIEEYCQAMAHDKKD